VLGDDLFARKIKTPTQVSKLDSAVLTAHENLVQRGTKKPVLVSEQDARPAVLSFEQKFDEVEIDNG